MNKNIYFVTSNESKFKEYQERIRDAGYNLIQYEMNLEEGRSMDIKDIVELKIDQAKKELSSKKILVDDRGFFIESLNGFPGPYVKLMLSTIGVEGVIKLLDNVSNRNANFLTGIGYYDGKENHYFIEEEKGFIVNDVRDGNTRDWTNILKIYGYQKISEDKALSEYSDDEWQKYIDTITQEDQLERLVTFLKTEINEPRENY